MNGRCAARFDDVIPRQFHVQLLFAGRIESAICLNDRNVHERLDGYAVQAEGEGILVEPDGAAFEEALRSEAFFKVGLVALVEVPPA